MVGTGETTLVMSGWNRGPRYILGRFNKGNYGGEIRATSLSIATKNASHGYVCKIPVTKK